MKDVQCVKAHLNPKLWLLWYGWVT